MKSLIALVLAMTLAGCGSTIASVEKVPDTQRIEAGTASCSKGPGICFKCGWTVEMKYKCIYGYWGSCPGNQPAKYSIWTQKVIYSDGTSALMPKKELIEVSGVCN